MGENKDNKYDFTINDFNDVLMHFFKVHDDEIQSVLSPDFILFQPEERDITFFREQIKVASQLKIFIKDEKESKAVYDMIINDIKIITLMKRNTSDNFLVKAVIEKIKELERKKDEENNKGIDVKGLLTPNSANKG